MGKEQMMKPALATHDLTKHFGSVAALEGLDLEVHQGETFGFLGPNGAGKSTTVRLLLSLIHPTRGTAEIMGVPVDDVARAHRQKIALVAAFMTRPDVLLLDEPTSGLDPLMEAQFQAVAREAAARGQTILLSSHCLLYTSPSPR